MINIKELYDKPKDLETMVTRRTSEQDYILSGVAINKKSGKAYNVDIQMNTKKLEESSDIKVACTCDDFQFRWAFVLNEKGALLNPKKYVLEPPKKTNPDNVMNACKHIHAFIKNELDGKLKQFSARKGTI